MNDDREMLEAAKLEVGRLERELERLHSWDGLMELLDEHWPESLIPTTWPDGEGRDTGPRIVSLIRWVDLVTSAHIGAIERLQQVDAERDAALAVIKTVTDSAREGLADCDDDCDMSAFWVLETLATSPIAVLAEHDRALKAEALEEGAIVVENLDGKFVTKGLRNPMPVYYDPDKSDYADAIRARAAEYRKAGN